MDQATANLLVSSLAKSPRFALRAQLPFKEWKNIFLEYVNEAKLTNKEAKSAFISLLDGDALSICLAIPSREKLSVNDFLETLQGRIQPTKDFRDSRNTFQKRSQKCDESIRVYCDKLFTIAKCGFSTYDNIRSRI